MKQGSTDDPFAEEADEPAHSERETTEADGADATEADDSGTAGEAGSTSPPQRGRLPYIHSRDGVKDGRTQRPVFLRDHVESGIDDLVDRMEAELGTDVYKTDVTEASMAVAQEHPELVLEKLQEWGYGWE